MGRKLLALGLVALKALCSVVIFFSAVFTVYAIGPELETSFRPVVSKLEILSIKETPEGQTEIRAAFRKIRDCEYVGIAWFAGSRTEGFQRVSVVLQRDKGDTSSPDRPVGYQKAGPWIIGVSPDELRHGSFAQLTHRCHPFWNTVTEFFP